LSATTGASVTTTPTITTTYTVTGTNVNGCVDTATIFITVNPLPTVSAGPDLTVCPNSSTTINSTGTGTIFSWAPATGLSSATVQNPTASPTTNTTYTLYVTDASGCINSDTVSVAVNPLPVVSAGVDDTICFAGNTTLNATGTGTFAWAPSGSLSNATISNPVASPVATTTYYVTITDGNGCTNTDSVTIVVQACAAPNASITASTNTICEGNCINFADNSTGLPDTWSWTFPGGTPAASALQNPGSVCFSTPGTYTVTLVSSNSFGSSTTTTIVTVNATPVADAGLFVSITPGGNTVLTGTGGGTYSWSPATGLSCTTCPNPTANPTVTTTYTLCVTTNGCTACDTVTVDVSGAFEWFVPSGFSPNGDGQNDFLFVRGVGVKSVHLVIYDRIGEKIFETSDISIGWDGTYKNQPMNNAVFVYYATVEFLDGTFDSKKGDITLVR